MTFEKADFTALAALWNSFFPPRYAVDADLLKQNTVNCPVFDFGASSILDGENGPTGFVAVKKSPCPGLFKGPDPDQAHISAIVYQDPVDGVDLMASVKSILRNRGVYRLVFGQDCRHFFPGCPDDFPALRDFLRVEGFEETSSSFDLEHDLRAYEPANPPEGVELRHLTPLDKAALAEFLEREFPGRWLYDTLTKVDEEGRLDFVEGLFVDGSLEGFAVTQDESHKVPIGGAVWKKDLGPNWGSLGPIGVSKRVRKKGLGDALLGFGLSDLKSRGVAKAIIDWTTLDKFYGKHGFTIERRYTGYALRLDV